jgi:hypothetical protein
MMENLFFIYSKVISPLLLSIEILPNFSNADCPKSRGAFILCTTDASMFELLYQK